jgi:hypothetical protein
MARYKTRMRQQAPVGRRQGGAPRRQAAPQPKLKARVGFPPGQPHPCRQYLARQGMGVIEDETTED